MDPHALGVPGEGIHFHVAGVAIVDVVLTLVAACFLARWLSWSVTWTFVCLVAASVVVHRLVGVETTLTKLVYGKRA